MKRSESEHRLAAVDAGDSAGIARIDHARATRAAGRRGDKTAAYAAEALAVDGLLGEVLAAHDRFVAIRDAAGVTADPSLPIHHLVAPVYAAFDQLAHALRTHWRTTVIPAASQAAGAGGDTA